MSGAYYNEIDPYAAEWLRALIAKGHIADGVVDTRSIEDVTPGDIREFTQCHFFAGIGVWSYALRLAGWDDERPVWTGSCPCQPFSPAGKGLGFADERHLWPAWHHLIAECRPGRVYGEQVADRSGLTWLDLVLADMEGTGYAIGAVDTCSAGFGAPHRRQRLRFIGVDLADGVGQRLEGRADQDVRGTWGRQEGGTVGCGGRAPVDGLVDSKGISSGTRSRDCGTSGSGRDIDSHSGQFGGMVDTYHERFGKAGRAVSGEWSGERRTFGDDLFGPVAYAKHEQRPTGQRVVGFTDDQTGRFESSAEIAGFYGDMRTGPTNGFWRDADWLYCRDGKWRPVEPGTFPLAHGASSRVGRLRAYGNAVDAEATKCFIKSTMHF